jgi:hypothetical protein
VSQKDQTCLLVIIASSGICFKPITHGNAGVVAFVQLMHVPHMSGGFDALQEDIAADSMQNVLLLGLR